MHIDIIIIQLGKFFDLKCDKDRLHSAKLSCKHCYRRHQIKIRASTIHLSQLTTQLNRRKQGETIFLKRIDQIQRTVLSRLKQRRRVVLDKINFAVMDEKDQKSIKTIFIDKKCTDLSGQYLSSCFLKLQKFNEQLRSYSQNLQIEFKQSITSLVKRIQEQKVQIVNRFSKSLVGNYQMSKQQKHISEFPNTKYPNKKNFSVSVGISLKMRNSIALFLIKQLHPKMLPHSESSIPTQINEYGERYVKPCRCVSLFAENQLKMSLKRQS